MSDNKWKWTWPLILAAGIGGMSAVNHFIRGGSEEEDLCTRISTQDRVGAVYAVKDVADDVREQCAALHSIASGDDEKKLEDYLKTMSPEGIRNALPKINYELDLVKVINSHGIPLTEILMDVVSGIGVFNDSYSLRIPREGEDRTKKRITRIDKNWDAAKKALDKLGFETGGEEGYHRIIDLAKDDFHTKILSFYAEAGCKLDINKGKYAIGDLPESWQGIDMRVYDEHGETKSTDDTLLQRPMRFKINKRFQVYRLNYLDAIKKDGKKALENLWGRKVTDSEVKGIYDRLLRDTIYNRKINRNKMRFADSVSELGFPGTEKNKILEKYKNTGLGHVNRFHTGQVVTFMNKYEKVHDVILKYIGLHNKANQTKKSKSKKAALTWEKVLPFSNVYGPNFTKSGPIFTRIPDRESLEYTLKLEEEKLKQK